MEAKSKRKQNQNGSKIKTEAKSKRKQNQCASCHRKCATCTSWYLPSTHFRPNARLLNHCLLDLYKIKDIYDAALYTLRSQPHAPSIPTQHNVVLIDTPLLDASPSFHALLQAASTFLPTLESLLLAKVTLVVFGKVRAGQQCVPSSFPLHNNFLT